MAGHQCSGIKKGSILSKIEAKLQDDESSLQDSWVDLAEPPSRGSTSSVTMYTDPGLLIDAQRSTVASRHSCGGIHRFTDTVKRILRKVRNDLGPAFADAWMNEVDNNTPPHSKKLPEYYTNLPKSLQSPNVEFDTTLEAVKLKLARDILPPGRNTDWIWDWSSRPEAQPPTEFRFRHPGSCSLTTPPNSPINYDSELLCSPLSLRHSKWIRREWCSVEVISVWLVSNVVTFMLGVCVGFCLTAILSIIVGPASILISG